MNPYYGLLFLVKTHQPCTREHLEKTASGRYKDQIDDCINLKYIMECGKNTCGETLYCITDDGEKIVNDPKE